MPKRQMTKQDIEAAVVVADVLASALGVSQQRVSQFVNDGVLIPQGRGAYPLCASASAYTAHLRGTASGRGGADEVASLMSERARLARQQQTGETAFRHAVARKELPPAGEVKAALEGITAKVRSGMLALLSRVSSQRGLCQADSEVLDREIREALTELSG